ncbi:MAG: hypothetical protein JKY43_05590 [Phycisphaerales bacterium]|nr:hypothetical protein [Phycisphaerales bacterium]
MLKKMAVVMCAIGVCSFGALADGVVCNSEGYYGAIDTLGEAEAIEVVGDIAYVADGSEGLKIFDVSDPSAMVLLGSFDTAWVARDVLFENSLISGKVVYVADGFGGLLVIDVNDPSNPSQIGSYATLGQAYGLAYHGGLGDGPYLIIAAGAQGVIALDVSFPFAPVFKDSHTTAGFAYDVAIDFVASSTGHLYVADGSAGLEMYRLLFGWMITPRMTTNTPSNARSVEVVGDIAYVADWSSGLQIIDLGVDRDNPVIIGSFNTSGLAVDVQVAGGTAYVADTEGGVQVIDVRVPASPVGLGVVGIPDAALALDVQGAEVFVASNEFGVLAFDLTETDGLVSSSLLDLYAWGDTDIYFPEHTVVVDDIAYVSRNGLHLFDVSGGSPVLINTFGLGTDTGGVFVSNGTAYLADSAGIQIIDVRVPTNLVLLGSHATPGTAHDVYVEGNFEDGFFAYIADGNSGMQVVDVTDSGSPTLVGNYAGAGVGKVEVAQTGFGKVAYIIDGNDFVILSVADETQPLPFGSYSNGRGTRAVLIDGDIAYVASGSDIDTGRLDIVDISLPLNPVIISSFDLFGEESFNGAIFELGKVGSMLYITDPVSGITMYDVTDPASPRFTGIYNKESGMMSLTIENDIGYMRSADGLFQLLDMSACAPCLADLTGDGVLDFFDISAFLSAFSNSDPAADFTGDGVYDFFDISAFLSAFGAGCP